MSNTHPLAVFVGLLVLGAALVTGAVALGFLVGLFFAVAEWTFHSLNPALVVGAVV